MQKEWSFFRALLLLPQQTIAMSSQCHPKICIFRLSSLCRLLLLRLIAAPFMISAYK